jgi:hypothetical protein
MSKIEFSIPAAETTYLRNFSAEIDILGDDEILVLGRMSDHRFAFEHVWKVRTPDYEVIEASARQSDQTHFPPELCSRYGGLKDFKIGRGFTKRVTGVLGDLPGAQEHLWLAIEMARVSQQVYQYTPEFEAQFPDGDDPARSAHIAWLKDRAYMPDLANSCYTYRDQSGELFKTRDVRCGFGPEIYRPKLGDKRFFWRNKSLAIAISDQGYACESAMEDRIHDIKVDFILSIEGVISNAQSRGLRLPYHGVCEDAQLRTAGLNGMRVARSYILQFADRIGGANGCTHLFDLATDCLKLFKF